MSEPSPSPLPPVPVTGVVEQFSRRLVVGWLAVPGDASPTLVTLHLGNLQVASTFATSHDTLSGASSVLRGGNRRAPEDGGTAAVDSPVLGTVHPWQLPNVPGPAGDRRQSRQEVRTFSFRIRDIWKFVGPETRITVRVDGRPLPIYGHGTYLNPPTAGPRSLAKLRRLLAEGHVFSQHGYLQLSKRLDVDWQRRTVAHYQRVREVLGESHGYEPFLVYGTLLGAVRENGFIGHDVDFDAAYVSDRSDPVAAADELVDVATTLIRHGFDVECMTAHLHVHDAEDRDTRIDLFHTFFDTEGVLRFPFGIAGSSTLRKEAWNLEEIPFAGGSALVPVDREDVVRVLYGNDWRQPKPGFNWNLDRTEWVPEAMMTRRQRVAVHWSNHYARTTPLPTRTASPFFDYLLSLPDLPRIVVDLGCGDGRDTCAAAASGLTVIALDVSPVGIECMEQLARDRGLGDRVHPLLVDIGDGEALRSALTPYTQPAGRPPVAFVGRFLLHAVAESTQQSLLRVISELAGPGDVVALEFRTTADEGLPKEHGRHYRRFLDAADLIATLRDDLGLQILHEEEGRGLSPYGDEDPVLCRVVARRN